ncbi:unnamed protein product [Rotaria socialis]|uniref:Annexin n=1 Tax=Rotaria socialis TaxID=392032 RepID=A0A818AT13_9BILA|nr:unnamed protein product [Rotaria socialis]CAF4447253.1 unnamed protein product [Rotaria socialis]
MKKVFDSNSNKPEKRLPRISSAPLFGHSNTFDYKRDAKYLSKILQQCNTTNTIDLRSILQFLSLYTCKQRMVLVHGIEYEYKYNLIDMVLQQPESPLRSCTSAMLIEPIELYVRNFHDLLTLKQTDKSNIDISKKLVEILLALSNDDTKVFKATYTNLFKISVEKYIESVEDEKSILSQLLIELLAGQRLEVPDQSVSTAKLIAQKLYESGEGKPGIDYDTFINIFTRDPFSQLSAIFDIYEDKYGRPIQEAIEREFQGKIEAECFQDMIEYTRSPGVYYAKILRQTLDKSPIDYITLTRIIIGHEYKDLSEIKLEYSKIYDETLDETIANRVDTEEIKSLFLMIITTGQHVTSSNCRSIHVDHQIHNSSTGQGTSPTASRLRKNFSHDALDKLSHVFKIRRPH